MKLSQLIFSFLMGYFSYSLIEILLRGYTHWTMCLTGGASRCSAPSTAALP